MTLVTTILSIFDIRFYVSRLWRVTISIATMTMTLSLLLSLSHGIPPLHPTLSISTDCCKVPPATSVAGALLGSAGMKPPLGHDSSVNTTWKFNCSYTEGSCNDADWPNRWSWLAECLPVTDIQIPSYYSPGPVNCVPKHISANQNSQHCVAPTEWHREPVRY